MFGTTLMRGGGGGEGGLQYVIGVRADGAGRAHSVPRAVRQQRHEHARAAGSDRVLGAHAADQVGPRRARPAPPVVGRRRPETSIVNGMGVKYIFTECGFDTCFCWDAQHLSVKYGAYLSVLAAKYISNADDGAMFERPKQRDVIRWD